MPHKGSATTQSHSRPADSRAPQWLPIVGTIAAATLLLGLALAIPHFAASTPNASIPAAASRLFPGSQSFDVAPEQSHGQLPPEPSSPSPVSTPRSVPNPHKHLVVLKTVTSFGLAVGDCVLMDHIHNSQSRIATLDCNTSHDAEVFAQFNMVEPGWPGTNKVKETAQTFCSEQFQSYVGIDLAKSHFKLYYYFPLEWSWILHDDRTITCIVFADSTYTGTLAGARR